ncbi:hypothetical protein [Asticcacaulis sp. AC402]|uniref:hypothetical protein n=1 Tax=Asticcacaulis sp. AC402 TaxID=1282361 RepID=UPI0003C3AD8F|nr:hypothetical protein [Asticcacaulis sp. AC402]ESQ74405.1 hypothetical protein ABAC402_14350 [Asticcacaulis sp. AC402]
MAKKGKPDAKAASTAEAAAKTSGRKVDRRISWLPAYIENADASGYFKFKNVSLRTLEETDYERILQNDAQWEDLQTRMSADFRHPLEVFPYDEGPQEKPTYRLNWIEKIIYSANQRWAKSIKNLTDISLPRRYYTIVRMNLEERFPGGRVVGEPGDGDLRDLLTAFRQMFRENLARYIFKKRLFQLLFSLPPVVLALAMLLGYSGLVRGLESVLSALEPGWAKLGASILTGTILIASSAGLYWVGKFPYRFLSETEFERYKNSQSESCKTLNTEAALRTKNLRNLITTMSARLGKDSTAAGAQQIRNSDDGEKWPVQAYRWTLLMYWLGRRMESIETFTQLQMWLIRRTHHFYRLFAVVSNNVMRRASYLFLVFAAAGLVFQGTHAQSMNLTEVYQKLVVPAWQWLKSLVGQTQQGADLSQVVTVASVVDQVSVSFTREDWRTQMGGVWTYLTSDAYTVTADALHIVCGLVVFWLAAGYIRSISRQSAKEWNTPLLLIRDNLGVINWDRFHSANLPFLLAEQVRNDKRMILKREDWVKR